MTTDANKGFRLKKKKKKKNRMAKSVDPDEMGRYVSSGSTHFAQVSGLVCQAERARSQV